MLKRDELSRNDSCLSKARDDERIFVLLARDVAAPHAVREWANERLRLGKNDRMDPQIQEALDWADQVEADLKMAGKWP